MSLEINSLDYEIDYMSDGDAQKLNPESGLVDFDPSENVLIFYDLDKKEQKFITKIKDVKLIDSFLSENIIAFEQEKEGKKLFNLTGFEVQIIIHDLKKIEYKGETLENLVNSKTLFKNFYPRFGFLILFCRKV